MTIAERNDKMDGIVVLETSFVEIVPVAVVPVNVLLSLGTVSFWSVAFLEMEWGRFLVMIMILCNLWLPLMVIYGCFVHLGGRFWLCRRLGTSQILDWILIPASCKMIIVPVPGTSNFAKLVLCVRSTKRTNDVRCTMNKCSFSISDTSVFMAQRADSFIRIF